MSRKHHPETKPLAEARRLLLAAAIPLSSSETIRAERALGRVTAEPVYARASVPHYHGAAMDGIALRAADVAGASEETPVDLELGTPDTVARPFAWVDTGNALPAWADAVVMIERVYAGRTVDAVLDANDPSGPRPASGRDARVVHVRAAAPRWQHVRLVGEDVVASEPLLPRGRRIRPWDVGALLAAGVDEVAVRPRPVVAILPTGDELIEPGEPRAPGRIVEFNSRMLAAFVEEWGGTALRLAPARDDLAAIRAQIEPALHESDVVCVIAGSSAGQRDFTALALGEIGEVLVRGVAVMPGKPAIVAAVARERGARASVALGIPGYPVSAAVVCRELLEPLVAHLLGAVPEERVRVRAVVPRALTSRVGHEELLRVALGEVGGRLVATPLARGASAIVGMARADGLLRIPSAAEVVAAGDELEVELLRPLAEVRETVLVAGAFDPLLGALEDALRAERPQAKLARAALGDDAWSALARGEAHVAAVDEPCLAADDAAGNEPRPAAGDAAGAPPGASVRAGADAVVVHLASRAHGLVVALGNPLSLTSRADLERADVRSAPSGLAPLAAAAAVQSGLADAALGVESAAVALGLGFVPLERRDYDLVLRADFAASDLGRALLAALRSAAFREAAARVAGCDASRAGEEKRLTRRDTGASRAS
ncbi:MAG TPA: molybdopterin-binding protein [Candidatus Binatia bacterium]